MRIPKLKACAKVNVFKNKKKINFFKNNLSIADGFK